MQVDHAVPEVLEDDIAAVLRHRRTDARIEKLLDLGDDFIVVGRRGMRFGGVGDHRIAGRIVFHDAAEDRRLEDLPVAVGRLGDGHEVGAEKHALDAFDREQPLRQGRGSGGFGGRKVHRPLLHDHAARKELQSRRIWRLLGLDEQPYLLVERIAATRSASLRTGTGRLRPRSNI